MHQPNIKNTRYGVFKKHSLLYFKYIRCGVFKIHILKF